MEILVELTAYSIQHTVESVGHLVQVVELTAGKKQSANSEHLKRSRFVQFFEFGRDDKRLKLFPCKAGDCYYQLAAGTSALGSVK